MLLSLIQRRRISVPRGFGWWVLFLVWTLMGVLVLQVDTPGAIPGYSSTRYLTWAFRLVQYLQATIVLLYVLDVRKRISAERVIRILSWMFVTIALGGLLGALAPQLDFPSLLEHALPGHLSSNQFIRAQVHPTVAQIQLDQGTLLQRPSAPFPYANEWGLNYACFLPFFVVGFLRRGSHRRRLFGFLIIVASVVPVVLSLNRGLWVTLGLSAAVVAARSAAAGRFRLIALIGAGALIAVVAITMSPLNDVLQNRFSSHNSNEGRAALQELTLTSVGSTSPVMGLGTTRNMQGSFNSIAEASTPDCPRCSPPPLGTQGLIWMVAFTTGIGGLACFLTFFLLQPFRHVRLKSTPATASLVVLITFLLTSFIYDLSTPALWAAMAAVAILESEGHSAAASAKARTFAGFCSSVRRHSVVMAICAGLGLASALSWQFWKGTPSIATVSILLPAEPPEPGSYVRPPSIDTEAIMLASPQVLSAVSERLGRPIGTGPSGLSVTAMPNTRILQLSLTDNVPEQARAGLAAAARLMLKERAERLKTRRGTMLTSLEANQGTLDAAARTFGGSLATQGHASRRTPWDFRNAERQLLSMSYAAGSLSTRIALVQAESVDPGRIVRSVTSTHVYGTTRVAGASGLLLGLLVGLLVSKGASIFSPSWRRAHRHRYEQSRAPGSDSDLPAL